MNMRARNVILREAVSQDVDANDLVLAKNGRLVSKEQIKVDSDKSVKPPPNQQKDEKEIVEVSSNVEEIVEPLKEVKKKLPPKKKASSTSTEENS